MGTCPAWRKPSCCCCIPVPAEDRAHKFYAEPPPVAKPLSARRRAYQQVRPEHRAATASVLRQLRSDQRGVH